MRNPSSFDLEIFEHSYIFCLGWKAADFVVWFKKKYGYAFPTPTEGAEGLCHKVESHNTIIVWTVKKTDPILIHECLHATNMTLDDIGHEQSLSNDEVQAYLLTLLFTKAKEAR